MRTPTLLISPWVSKGKVIGDPVGPTPTSLYEHTSIAATLKSLFNLSSFLTKRDAWAGDFSHELDRQTPRTDCPMHLPDPPTDAEMSAIERRILAARPATHVSTGSRRPAESVPDGGGAAASVEGAPESEEPGEEFVRSILPAPAPPATLRSSQKARLPGTRLEC